MTASNRRQTRLIDPAAQKRLILSLSVLPVVGLSIMVTVVAHYCNELYQQSLYAQAQLDALVPLLLAVSGVSAVTVVVLIFSAFKLSHQISGPSYRICKSLQRIQDGDISFKVVLRDGDHLNSIAGELNVLLDRLNEHPPEGFTTRESLEQEIVEESARDPKEAVEAAPSLVEQSEVESEVAP